MTSFKPYYQGIFDTFGYPLTKRAGTPATDLAAAEKRLGIRIPRVLRDYYLVAGRERRFNASLNRFLAPRSWFLDGQHLVFLEENQSVLWWAASTRSAIDPAVFQGVNDQPIRWVREHRKLSVFLAVMLHYHAVSDGFRHVASAPARDDMYDKLNAEWTYAGEVNHLWAYRRQNQVVCVTPGGDAPWMPAMVLLAGAKTKSDLQAIAESLSVSLQPN